MKLYSLLLLFLLCASPCFAAVAVDNADLAFADGFDTITLSFTVTGSNTLALCGSTQTGGSLDISTVAFNGVGMTPITRIQPYLGYEFSGWEMTGVSGTHDFIFTSDAASYIALGCSTFTGVDQVGPVGSYQAAIDDGSGSSFVSFTVPTDGMSWDYASAPRPDCTESLTPGAGQTALFNECGTSVFITALSSYRATTGDHTWTAGVYWGQLGVPINPVGAAPTTVRHRPIIQ